MSLLYVTGLGKSFGGNRAVDGVDFELAAGEMLAMIGRHDDQRVVEHPSLLKVPEQPGDRLIDIPGKR